MAEITKKKTRMYEPWGYQEENNYQGAETILDNELEEFFADAKYDKEKNKIIFSNKDGEEKATLDVSEFAPSGGTSYTFGGGLQENDGNVSVLIDSSSENYISTSDDGIKISGVDSAIADAVSAEEERAKTKENELDEKIDNASSGLSEAIEGLIEKLGYQDNDTLVTTNEHEVAFGEYNISNSGEEASGQTIFSIGNGTSDDNRSNAVEVMKNGDVYLWIEGEFMNINKLLGQIAHEVYDTDSTHSSHFFDGE